MYVPEGRTLQNFLGISFGRMKAEGAGAASPAADCKYFESIVNIYSQTANFFAM
jgi:hypothetical protein